MVELLARNYERVSIEIIKDAILGKKLPVDFEMYGRWWDRNEEIDVVALNRRTNEILFGEVKWSNKKVGIDIYENLKRKSEIVDWGKGITKKHFALFSKSGFTNDMLAIGRKEKVYLFHEDNLI